MQTISHFTGLKWNFTIVLTFIANIYGISKCCQTQNEDNKKNITLERNISRSGIVITFARITIIRNCMPQIYIAPLIITNYCARLIMKAIVFAEMKYKTTNEIISSRMVRSLK